MRREFLKKNFFQIIEKSATEKFIQVPDLGENRILLICLGLIIFEQIGHLEKNSLILQLAMKNTYTAIIQNN